ncbi:hypothetical protein V2I01_41515 [Micromonospora sp. BRA006-A]|nr:hypothetical protein [Micromonospora sp. BRA006-A]
MSDGEPRRRPGGCRTGVVRGPGTLLAAARRAVTAAADGTSTVLELPGSPGIGKTALLERCGRLARAAGLTVLSAVGRSPRRTRCSPAHWRSHDGTRGTGRRDRGHGCSRRSPPGTAGRAARCCWSTTRTWPTRPHWS